jgi:glutaredoxin
LNAQVLGISVDHVPCLKAWAESLGGIHFPLLSDFWPHGRVAEQYGVLRAEGHSERAIFVIDGRGIIRYIDVHAIDDQPDNEVLFAELARLAPASAAPAAAPAPGPAAAELPHGGIVMYCTPWCPDCRNARQWLKACDLPFTEVDVTRNPDAGAQVRRWNNGSLVTPTFDIDGVIVPDFDVTRLREILKLE